ncbi:divergent PAP2 family protein [candidate division WOR-3 bacterium]|nr:divergent PAP2 family protein [candidate division WOR-3 bacterium]
MRSNLLHLFLLPYLSGLSCQLIKIFNHWIMRKRFRLTLKNLLELGGLPSAHSAATITLTTLIAIYYGVASPLFIISLFLSIFIMGEAFVVRGVISRHSELIKKLAEINPQKELALYNLPGTIGHTPMEVIIGVIFGVFFALAFV